MPNIFRNATFDEWLRALDYYVSGYTGRHLADLPALRWRAWYQSGRWTAQTLAEMLTEWIGAAA